MTLNDPALAEIVRNGTPVTIENRQFTVHKANGGKCDGCYYQSQLSCPTKAVSICTSNRGNIFKLYKSETK